MTPTDDGGLVHALSRELVDAADRAWVPVDGRARVDARIRRRRVHRRVQAGVAAVLTVLVVIAGIVAFEDGRGEQSVPIVTSPGAHLLHFVPPLAPEGIDWWVESYSPSHGGSDGSAYYEVGFEVDDLGWSVKVDGRDDRRGQDGQMPPETSSPGELVEVDGREVLLSVDEAGGVAGLGWTDPSGASVALIPHRPGPPPGSVAELTSALLADHHAIERPTVDQAVAIAALIRPVDHASWRAALLPAVGAPDPHTGSTVRPIHLGLAAPPSVTALSARPWTSTQSDLHIDGFDPLMFRLTVNTPGSTPAGSPDLALFQNGQPVSVRGVEGQVLQSKNYEEIAATTSPSTGEEKQLRRNMGYQRMLSWEEGGSSVQLQAFAGPTVDELLAVASSLVVLDDAQWLSLFVLDGELGSPVGQVGATPSAGPSTPSMVPDGSEVVLPQLAPRVEGWRFVGHEPAAGYGIEFVLNGLAYKLSVYPPPSDGLSGLEHYTHPFRHQGRDLLARGFEHGRFDVQYLDEGGFLIRLSVEHPDDGRDGVDEAIKELKAGLDVIAPVDDATWWAALNPIYWLLRLGPTPEQGVAFGLNHVIGVTQQYFFVASDSGKVFRVTIGRAEPTHDEPRLEDIPVMVRGKIGFYETAAYIDGRHASSGPMALSDLGRVIVWEEGNSRIALGFGADTSIDEAVDLANGFAVMEDAEWRTLLNLG